jgi:DinB superfamily
LIFRIGLENNNEGCRTIAWVLEYPGCFAYGADADSALTALIVSIRDYAAWIAKHEPRPWLIIDEIELHIEETWGDYNINASFDRDENSDYYMVGAWFQHDWKPLTAIDIQHGLKLLTWSRADLLKAVDGLSVENFDQTYPGERWSIKGILGHVGGAEWWYMERIGLAFPRADVPEEPFARLEKVRRHLNETLIKMDGVNHVVGEKGEFWSPRKLLRRALWHERDHTEHIRKLL